MTVPAELFELMERFDRERVAYRSGDYNEAKPEWISSIALHSAWMGHRKPTPSQFAQKHVVSASRIRQ